MQLLRPGARRSCLWYDYEFFLRKTCPEGCSSEDEQRKLVNDRIVEPVKNIEEICAQPNI